MKAIPKPSEKTLNAVGKLFKNGEEINAQTFMETVIENQGSSYLAEGVGFAAEVAGLGAYSLITKQLKNEVDPETGKLPPEWDEVFTTEYLWTHYKKELKNLTECKGVAKFVMFALGGRNAQRLAVQEALTNSKNLIGVKIKSVKTADNSGFELTMPDGKKAFAVDLKEAAGICNYMMMNDAVNSAEETVPTQWRKIKIGGEEVEVAVTRDAKGVETVNFRNARKRNADGKYEQFVIKTESNLLRSENAPNLTSQFDVLSAEAENVSTFEEINEMRKKISLAKLEDKSQHKALFAKLKAKEQDIKENNVLLKLGTKAGDNIDKHSDLVEFTRNSNHIDAVISTKSNNVIYYYDIKIDTDDSGNILSKTKTEIKNYKPKPAVKPTRQTDYTYGYSEDRTAYDGGMSEAAFDAFRMRMYPDLFGTYEVKDKVVKGERNPVYKSLEHLDTQNNKKPINLAPLGDNSVRGRNLLTLSYEIFDEAKANGIKRLIDLRAESGDKNRIKEIDGKKYVNGVEYVHIPMDYSTGRCDSELIQNMSEFFDAMDKGNVYIGCNLGSHRTDFAIAINYALNTKTKEASPMLYLNMTDIVSGVRRVYKKIMKMTPEERKANNVSDDLLNILPKDMVEVEKRLKRIAQVTSEAK